MDEPNGRASMRWYHGARWVCCPYCEKKQFPITPLTKIEHLWYQCKKCKKDFLIDVTD